MYVPFAQLNPGARIWIYQSRKPFDDLQHDRIDGVLRPFLDQWRAHGKLLRSSYAILHRQFIVIAVDEKDQQATGCSIDDSVGIIQHLEKEIAQPLLDRSKVPLLVQDQIEMVDFRAIKDLVRKGVISNDTKTFDNTVQRKGDLENNWIIPVGKSWIRRYLS